MVSPRHIHLHRTLAFAARAHGGPAPTPGSFLRLGRGLAAMSCALVATLALGACDGRDDAMKRAVGASDEKKGPKELPDPGPSHALRDQLAPVLEKIYPTNKVPRIVEADISVEGEHNYEVEPGVAAVVRFPTGLSKEQQVEAVLMGVAESDAWAFRPKARRTYADQIHRVKRGFGDDQKEQILKAYAHLRLLQFFNSEEADAAIAALPAELKAPVEQMKSYYVGKKEEVWNDWMEVKMYARRVVAGDEPFRGVLREIKKELGKEEPPPRTWEESMDAPFVAWAKQIRSDEKLAEKLTNMRELREREEFFGDTHSLWVMEGSEKVPEKAKDVAIDRELGFAALREDLGGGYNDMTYVFSRKLKGSALKKAYLRSIIYGHLLHDFQMLATAGSDFAKREDGIIDAKTAIVPDEYDPLYAKCGSGAAIDTFVANFKSEFDLLSDVSGAKNPDKVLNEAHECVIEGARGDIHIPAKDDDKDVEGPAPGSRLALYQMLARFENVDVTAMQDETPTEEDETIAEQEALLKKLNSN